jgi:hypothetical protein
MPNRVQILLYLEYKLKFNITNFSAFKWENVSTSLFICNMCANKYLPLPGYYIYPSE